MKNLRKIIFVILSFSQFSFAGNAGSVYEDGPKWVPTNKGILNSSIPDISLCRVNTASGGLIEKSFIGDWYAKIPYQIILKKVTDVYLITGGFYQSTTSKVHIYQKNHYRDAENKQIAWKAENKVAENYGLGEKTRNSAIEVCETTIQGLNRYSGSAPN